jgi:hypothetical protein
MKALCVQNPWAALIRDGRKTLEVRSWKTAYRGPLVIVASRKWSSHEQALVYHTEYSSEPVGCTLCVVDLCDIREGKKSDTAACGGVDPRGYWVWELADPRTLPMSPVKGRLGLFSMP